MRLPLLNRSVRSRLENDGNEKSANKKPPVLLMQDGR